MPFFQWNDTYSVGVSRFDQEHKKLIDLTNQFYEAMKAGKGKEIIGSTCEELIKYTKTHFANEELALRSSSYPHMAEHEKEHALFTQRVMELKGKLDAGEMVMATSIGNFLKDWLINHIMGTDKKYTTFLT